MFEIRIYKKNKKGRIRTAKLNSFENKSLWSWIKLWFILKKYTVRG